MEDLKMKADYKNWMPQGMINGFAAATAVCWFVFWLVIMWD